MDKQLSTQHENQIADMYGGVRSRSSGASVRDAGDVRKRVGTHDGTLFECKRKGSHNSPLKRKPTLLRQMEKIADEAYAEHFEPALALRFYWPESPLANVNGWIDMTVRLTGDDAARSRLLP